VDNITIATNFLSKSTTIFLSLIELAFEGSQYLDFDNENRRIKFSNDTFKRAIRFLTNFDATERLIKICENIIENKGTFKP